MNKSRIDKELMGRQMLHIPDHLKKEVRLAYEALFAGKNGRCVAANYLKNLAREYRIQNFATAGVDAKKSPALEGENQRGLRQ